MAHPLNGLLLCLIFKLGHLDAKDLGICGHTFSIEEEDLLAYIKKKILSLSERETKEIRTKINAYYLDRLEHLNPLSGVSEAVDYRVSFHDPTLCVVEDIKDHEGETIVKKGEHVNPLDQLTLTQGLLFFDGANKAHIQWALEQNRNCKWILTGGSALQLETKQDRPVYFDQAGLLVKKLQIEHIPARVTQEGSRLKIEEIPIGQTLCAAS